MHACFASGRHQAMTGSHHRGLCSRCTRRRCLHCACRALATRADQSSWTPTVRAAYPNGSHTAHCRVGAGTHGAAPWARDARVGNNPRSAS
eukprot:scaffold96748_cov88-Phaeocystis_antarctica.AAC.2